MDRRKRILKALEESGKTRQSLADKLGLSRGAVSEMLNKEGEFDSVKYLEATAELTGFSFEWLRTGAGSPGKTDITTRAADNEKEKDTLKTIEKLEMLVDSQRRTIELLEKENKRLEAQVKRQKIK